MSFSTADILIAAATEPRLKEALTEGVEGLTPAIMTAEQYAPQGGEDGPKDYNLGQAAALANGFSQFPVRLPRVSLSTLPDAATWVGALVFVTDATGGAVPAYSDGAGWRRTDTNVIVS